MGKSDQFIFLEYLEILKDIHANSIAFLGFSKENALTRSFNSYKKDFYDISLGNWQINSDWSLLQKYDLIVCTRCAYFSKNPQLFIEKCKKHLTTGGHALIDWGLGDHWRFKNYKVGWVRDGEQEYAYQTNNFLYSCYWNDDLMKDDEVQAFWNAIKNNPQFRYGEETLKSVIEKEIPQLVNYKCKKITTKFLWPESPQLYIMTLITNCE